MRQSIALVALAVVLALVACLTEDNGGGTGPTNHSGEIEQDEIWHPSGNPHILDSDVYTGDNVTLTIMPGCIVQSSADVELYSGYSNPGSIIPVGTATEPITFTS